MSVVKILGLAFVALMTTACISEKNLRLENVTLPAGNMIFNGELSKDPHKKFICDNGYKVAVTYRSSNRITLSFRTDKDTFVDKLFAQGGVYVNQLGNLKWQENNQAFILFYPDREYRTTQKIWQTACRGI